MHQPQSLVAHVLKAKYLLGVSFGMRRQPSQLPIAGVAILKLVRCWKRGQDRQLGWRICLCVEEQVDFAAQHLMPPDLVYQVFLEEEVRLFAPFL